MLTFCGKTDPLVNFLLLSFGKRIVIVDGVGYPSVGSICDLSNAHVAQALSAPVLLVGKSGVGDAVDSFNINTRFFESYGSFIISLSSNVDAIFVLRTDEDKCAK